MKKFLKCKLEFAESISPIQHVVVNTIGDQNVERKNEQQQSPQSPDISSNTVKNTSTVQEQTDQKEELGINLEHNNLNQFVIKPRGVCRYYNQGNCTRQACKYEHKYKFCVRYMKSACKFNNCKYVHAKFLEQKEYYKTGVMPEPVFRRQRMNSTNTVNMRKQNIEPVTGKSKKPIEPQNVCNTDIFLQQTVNNSSSVMLFPPPPLPPPPPPQPSNEPIKISPDFTKPPPPLYQSADNQTLNTNYLPDENIHLELIEKTMRSILQPNTSTSNPSWREIIDVSNMPHVIQPNEPLGNKCKNCEIMQFRLLCSINRMQRVIESSEQIDKQMVELKKKYHDLHRLFVILLNSKKQPTTSNDSLVLKPRDSEESENLTRSIIQEILTILKNSMNINL